MSVKFASKEDAEHMTEAMIHRYGRLFEAKQIPNSGMPQFWGVINTTTQAFMSINVKERFPLPMVRTMGWRRQ